MRCRLCLHPAGWFRRRCRLCSGWWQVYQENRGAPLHAMLPLFAAVGANEERLRAFLAADPDGEGAIEDRIAADMANQLFESFGGTAGGQTPEQVRRLRQRGAWKTFGQPPE